MQNTLARTYPIVAVATVVLAALSPRIPVSRWDAAAAPAPAESPAPEPTGPDDPVVARWRDDVAAMETFRPGYPFWQHVFTIPDGHIAFGSATDGRLFAVFPTIGSWTRRAEWTDPALAGLLDGEPLSTRLRDRRDQVARLLERAAGPVVHNATRGMALQPSVRRYGRFLADWAAIYERFGVPADIGLAHAIVESGLNGTRRSEAGAVGFCQWMRRNWQRLDYFAPMVLQAHNQTSQAPYCAAYLSVLGTKYGSFIPALSEHNAGGTNVGRTLVTGEQLGATDVRARYFRGAQLARDLRELPGRAYREVYRTYGPRSFLYAEMVFGAAESVGGLMASTPQAPLHAMRTSRAIPLAEIVARTGLSVDEVRRFNPALVQAVPARATLYLPFQDDAFGADVAFWRQPPSREYAGVLDDFVRLEADPERWDDPAFAPVLTEFRRRFRETETEEGVVMDTVLAYAMDQAYTSSRRALVAEFRTSDRVRRLIEQGLLDLAAGRTARADVSAQ